MNWLNLSDEEVQELAQAEEKFPIAAGRLLMPAISTPRPLRISLQREVVVAAVRRNGKRGTRTRIKVKTA